MMSQLGGLARINWLLVAILMLGLGLRLYGINYGLPYTYGPDEPTYLTLALQMLRTGDLNPHWWYYPTLMFYLNAVALGIYFLFGRMTGQFVTPADLPLPEIVTMGVGKLALPAEFLIARGLTAIFCTAAVLLLYAVARQLNLNRWVALFAALLFAVSPTAVIASHRIGPDIFALFFSLIAFFFAIQIVDSPRLRNYVGAGIGAGLAISCKYNAGLILVALLTAHVLQFGWSAWRRKEIYLALVVVGLAFLAGTPFALLDFQNFWDGVRWQAFSYSAEGHAGQEGDALAWYVSYLPSVEGWAVLLSVLGTVYALFVRSKKLLTLVSFPLFYFLFVSQLLVRNERTIMQIIPFLNVLAAVFVGAIVGWLLRNHAAQRKILLATSVAICLLLCVPLIQESAVSGQRLLQIDGRETARVWIEQNLPAGARIALEPYSPYVSRDRFAVEGMDGMISHPADWYIQNGFEYLVFSYGTYGRFYENRNQYAEMVKKYDELFARFPEVKRFNDGGFEIRICKTGVTNLPSQRVNARLGIFSNWLEFIGYDAAPATVSQSLDVALYWRALASRREPLALTVRLLDRNDNEVTQSKGALFGQNVDTDRWPEAITRVPWKIAAPNQPGLYRLELDVDAEGQGRVPVLSRQVEPISDKIYTDWIKVAPSPVSADELSKATSANVRFGDVITLRSYSIKRDARVGETLPLALYWECFAKPEKDYTAFLHLIDANGKTVLQLDMQPLNGSYPTSIWDAHEIIRDDYTLKLPSDIPSGEYKIEIGLYEYPSLTRLNVFDAQGKNLGDHIVLDDIVKVTR